MIIQTMIFTRRSEAWILLLGDIVILGLALWLTLLFRTADWPNRQMLENHLVPFLPVFLVWLVIFFIFDLYRRPSLILGRRLPGALLTAQSVNTVIAIVFFYLIPYFGITPKVVLFIYLIISFVLLWFWRHLAGRLTFFGRRERVYFLCQGEEVEEIKKILGQRAEIISGEPADLRGLIVVINPDDHRLTSPVPANFYRLLFTEIRFINVNDLYETLFDRVPVSLIRERWFLDHLGSRTRTAFDIFKRAVDIILGGLIAVLSLIFYPLICLAIKLDDGGRIFFSQERVGRKGRPFRLIKFRTMSEGRVTRVGKFLRLTRLDELPQLGNVLSGSLSLIGPRPELPERALIYEKEIPYYSARHLVKPGLTGWAQLYGAHPHHQVSAESTKNKLSYDLYYVKNRSVWLDITIALKTIKLLLSLQGK